MGTLGSGDGDALPPIAMSKEDANMALMKRPRGGWRGYGLASVDGSVTSLERRIFVNSYRKNEQELCFAAPPDRRPKDSAGTKYLFKLVG